MADTPINLFPPAVPWGWVEIGGKKYPVHIDTKQHKILEAFLRRLGGESTYVISDIANLTLADGSFLVGDGTTVVAESGSTARASLGLGTIATQDANDVSITGGSVTGITDLAIADGGTGASTASGARTALDVPSNAEAILDTVINAKGDLIVGSAADTPAILTVGTNTHVLTADSSAPNGIKWAAGGGGGSGSLVLLESLTASASASLDFASTISSTYDEYLFEFIGLVPATNNVDLQFRVSTDGGTNYDSSNLYVTTGLVNHDAVVVQFGQALTAPTSAWKLRNAAEIHNTSTYCVDGTLRLFHPGSTSLYKRTQYHGSYVGGATAKLTHVHGGGVYQSTTAVNAIQFLFTSGNISSGVIRSYGIVKS